MRLGCDPEVFLMNKEGLLPVFGMIGADKWNPKQVEGMAPGFTFQEDNVALEFGIPPASCEAEWVNSVFSVQKAFLEKHPELTFSKLSCGIFSKDLIDDKPQAFVFGCEPDFNAWNGKENPKPKLRNKYQRAAGGHIHIETELDKRRVVQAMDFYLGIPSILMDLDVERRKLYGKAGAFRPKPYGVEYRTLSNFWIFEEKYIRWVWRQTDKALTAVVKGFDYKDSGADIQRIINEGNVSEAQMITEAFEMEVV